MAYRLVSEDCIQRVRDGALIPRAEYNVDYQEFLIWEAAGNIAAPVVAPEPTPQQQIEALEQQSLMALQRPYRDVMLAIMEKEAAAIGVTKEQLRAVNPGYRRVKELEEQINAIRATIPKV